MRGTVVAFGCLVVVSLVIAGPTFGSQTHGFKPSRDTVATGGSGESPWVGRKLLGIHTHDVNYDLKNTIASSEWPYMRNVRLGVKWADLEPSKGSFNWAGFDAQVNGCLSLGVESILVCLSGPIPAWAQDPGCPGDPAYGPPKKLVDFKDFCYAFASRYKGYVNIFQIWQEPGWDLDAEPASRGIVYFSGYCDHNYMGLMRAGYQGIKAGNPDAYVATGALINGLQGGDGDYVNYETLLAGGNQDLSMKITSADKDIVAERPMYFNYQDKWTGGHVEAGIAQPGTDWYLAEGATQDGFDEWICIQNPGNADANVNITYMFPGGATQGQGVLVGAHSRTTISVNAAVGQGKDVSTHITSSAPVVVERPMYFNYKGAWTGGSVDSAVAQTSKIWYLAEGATHEGFDEWICLMNPNPAPADVRITYMFLGGGTQVQDIHMDPTSRSTVMVNAVVGPGKDVSAKIEAGEPIIAERPMYYNYQGKWTGGDTQVGSVQARTSWFICEGTTRDNSVDGQFEEWISIQNPGDRSSSVDLTYMFPGGATQPGHIDVAAHSRSTILVNSVVGPDKDVSVQLDSDEPIIVERPMYFNYHGIYDDGHVSIASSQAGREWYFAEGTTLKGFEEWLTLQNPGAGEAHITITFMFSDGTTQDRQMALPPNSRTTVSVNNSVSIATICDGVAAHPYTYPVDWGKYYSDIVEIVNRNGYPGCEVPVTEIGWPHASERPGFTPEGQAEAIGQLGVGGLWNAGCKKIWIYQDKDDAPGQRWSGEDSDHGLFDYMGNPMPAWGEYKNWQAQMPDYGNLPGHLPW